MQLNHRNRIISSVIVLFIILTEATAKTQFTGRLFTTHDGLPANQVHHLVQDKSGFIWLGTPNGLCRFDGYSFINLTTIGVGNGKVNANIGTIHLDEKNNLMWLRTATFHYACYDLQKEQFLDYSGEYDPQKTFQRFIAEDGGIWMYESYKGIRHVAYKKGRLESKDYTIEHGNLPNVRIKRLLKDEQRGMWVMTDKGLFYIDQRGTLQVIAKGKNIMMGNHWKDITLFLTEEGHVLVFNKEGKQIKDITIPSKYYNHDDVNGNIIWQDKWVIMTRSTVITMNCNDFTFEKPDGLQMLFGIPLDDEDGNQWVSDKDGILHLFPQYGPHKTFRLLHDKGYTFARKRRFSSMSGTDGKFYIATYGNGLFVYDPISGQTDHYTANDKNAFLASNYLTSITKDKQGNIWICQEDAGLVLLEKKQYPTIRQIYPAVDQQGEMSNYINRIWREKSGNVLFSTLSRHIYQLNPQTWTITPIGTISFDEVQTDRVNDTYGRTWIGTWENGLYLEYTDSTGKIKRKSFLTKSATESRINALTIDSNGLLWIATYNGLYVLNSRQKDIDEKSFFHYDSSDGLPSNNILCILALNDGSLWAGGQGTGVVKCTFNEKRELFTHIISTQQGLANNNVHSLIADNNGQIWAGTDEALSCIYPKELKAISYQTGESLLSRLYSNNSSLKLDDGKLMFGTHDGLTIITPLLEDVQIKRPTKVSVTNIDIEGISIYESEQNINLFNSNGCIKLAYDENSLTFHFSNFDYANIGQTMYQFYLEGIDKGWREPSTQYSVDYGNLPPGHYTFHLRTSEDGEETTLDITIQQPWYNTWWAWFLYLIIFGTAAWYVYRNWRERFRLHQQMKIEKEVSEFRANFFTQVAHEFRTPLAIISGAVDKLGEEGNTQRKPMQTAKRGVRRLTQLVNQLMEFRKINTGNLRLQVEQGEIIGFIRDIYQDFWNAAQQKEQTITFTPFDKKYETIFDRHILDTITYNLFSNAVKYTPQRGTINIRLKKDDGLMQLIVEDSGPGIDPQREQELFQPFMHGYASQGGMGIGLYTAYKMAQTHKGNLAYSSSETYGGSKFTLTLPADDNSYTSNDYKNQTAIEKKDGPQEQAEQLIREMQPQALNEQHITIIEDDPDMLEQIKTEVGVYFHIDGYTNGQSGIEGMKSQKPSLLICDVMLPDINGYDIVKKLKADEELKDIPVIMLTALDDEKHQIKGYEAGADDYMVKPCNYRILMARAFQLIRWSEKKESEDAPTRKVVSVETESTPTILTNTADKRFLERINAIVSQHISDPDFNIDQMAELMRMGRTKLYGKVKELTGMSPNKLFMSERMRMAAELLEDGELNISEIGYQVGIPDASYFNKCFKQHFGVAPSKYRKGS